MSIDGIKYSSTQINIEGITAFDITKWIEANIKPHMLNPDEKNEELHVTIKYGIHTKDPTEVAPLLSHFGIVPIILGDISVFDNNEKYDVLKIDIEFSDELFELNKLISTTLTVTDSFPDYRPHITLAYLQKGYKDLFIGSSYFNGIEYLGTQVIFSTPEKERTLIGLI